MPKQDKHHKCPCCGYAIERPIVHKNGHSLLSPVHQAIFNIVKKSPEGISAEAIYQRVWGHRERDAKIVAVTICHLNKKIKRWGLRIRSKTGRGCSEYRLLQIEAQPHG